MAGLDNYDDTTIKGDIAANTEAIETEVTRAKAAESTLNNKIPTAQTSYIGYNKNFVYSEGKTGSTKNVISAIETGRTEFDNFIYLTYWGNSNSSDDIVLEGATTEKAGVMTADDKRTLNYNFKSIEVVVTDGKLNLLNNAVLQHTVITGDIRIILPTIYYSYAEIHLLFEGVTGSTIKFPNVVWKEAPTEFVEGATYEFIFTWIESKNKWYAGFIKYE